MGRGAAMTSGTRYSVLAERDDETWVVTVPELEVTAEAPRRDDIEPVARQIIASSLEVDPHSFDLDIETLST